eukprot:CAMPEP_0194486580 /NCGR_PEP_ID=MMETSP0253-20130528/7171_1 /TAXON_ID=2966 /ORGANISM="Noctiluca scintillans" /LENGTH=243 /DNA_ID=CAMNT_0039326681 /DNA_START=15 /DNA_END=746 /DNA_ORIENTATION=+
MATWSALGGGWQNAAGVGEGRAHPKLFEAFGAGPRSTGFSPETATFGGATAPFGAGIPGPMETSMGDEVPRAFSMKTDANFGSNYSFPAGSFTDSGVAPSSGDPCWVTVFGFPGRVATLVRQQLEMLCGPIMEVRQGDGNFVHVRFCNASAARQCLAHNGHAISGKLLIGCVPCTDVSLGTDSVESDAPMAPQWQGVSRYGSEWPTPWAEHGRYQSVSPVMVQGPQMRRSSFLWRLVDIIFDI